MYTKKQHRQQIKYEKKVLKRSVRLTNYEKQINNDKNCCMESVCIEEKNKKPHRN